MDLAILTLLLAALAVVCAVARIIPAHLDHLPKPPARMPRTATTARQAVRVEVLS